MCVAEPLYGVPSPAAGEWDVHIPGAVGNLYFIICAPFYRKSRVDREGRGLDAEHAFTGADGYVIVLWVLGCVCCVSFVSRSEERRRVGTAGLLNKLVQKILKLVKLNLFFAQTVNKKILNIG